MAGLSTSPTPPLPPPPPPPRRMQIDEVYRDKSAFVVHGIDVKNVEFEFPKPADQHDGPSLRTVVGHFLGTSQSSRASVEKVIHILGRLRCLQFALRNYNDGLATSSPAFVQYWRQHTTNLISSFGYRLGQEAGPLQIAGLDDLVNYLESSPGYPKHEYQSLIDQGQITFDGLNELFRPDVPVKASIVSHTAPSVFRVTDAFYEERRGLFGTQKHFRVTMEAVVLVGDHFSVASFSEVLPAWSGDRARRLSDFAYQPVSEAEQHDLIARAAHGASLGSGGAKYLSYSPDSFFMHLARSRQKVGGSMSGTLNSQSPKGGRIMIDMARGASLGHYPCQGVDEPTLAIIQLAGRYRQWLATRSPSDPIETAPLMLWDNVPSEFLVTLWPALVGFSFTAKCWGHVITTGISPIEFQDKAFDHLVLSQERKQIIRAVVRSGSKSQTQDLVSGKQGGLILLLHGPPGVGKTLTAEAVAEVLHRPLYYVSMGELGLTPDKLEARLTDVLELCAEWDALAVLDEADVFLETRSTSDLVRNAMVCVMLRILEYHPGILFLTTNRVRTLDPAFESRITLAVKYEPLNHEARLQVWESQLSDLSETAHDFEYAELAEHQLNGRQIKNVVRLALSLAKDQSRTLSQSILLKTLEITSLGNRNMGQDNSWESVVSKDKNNNF